jgi:calcineurin-like phosphoesterase family protein
MRILCVSDQVDPLVYSSRLKERFGDVDLILAAGDLPMEYLGFITSMLNKPVYYIEGNHDLGRIAPWGADAFWRRGIDGSEAEASGAIDLGFHLRRVEGLIVLGLPGSMRYNHGPNQFTEFQMGLRIALFIPRLLLNRLFFGRACDIVLTHAPPRAIHDRDDQCHRGFKAFNWLMRFARPRWLVHGHVHLYDLADVRVTESAGTTVVNAFGHWVIDTEEGHS